MMIKTLKGLKILVERTTFAEATVVNESFGGWKLKGLKGTLSEASAANRLKELRGRRGEYESGGNAVPQ
jgi:hypothetical protein